MCSVGDAGYRALPSGVDDARRPHRTRRWDLRVVRPCALASGSHRRASAAARATRTDCRGEPRARLPALQPAPANAVSRRLRAGSDRGGGAPARRSDPPRPRAPEPLELAPTCRVCTTRARAPEPALASPLRRTGLEITRVGFGACAIGGGGWEFGWGPQEDEQSIAAIHRALELGVNWIDTAAAYGLGRSERIVGGALKGMSERPYVFTKCSLLEGPNRGTTPGAVAVAWTLRHPAVDGAIVGFRSRDQVDPIVPAANLELTDEDLAIIEGARSTSEPY